MEYQAMCYETLKAVLQYKLQLRILLLTRDTNIQSQPAGTRGTKREGYSQLTEPMCRICTFSR
jgi:hypothetical protein